MRLTEDQRNLLETLRRKAWINDFPALAYVVGETLNKDTSAPSLPAGDAGKLVEELDALEVKATPGVLQGDVTLNDVCVVAEAEGLRRNLLCEVDDARETWSVEQRWNLVHFLAALRNAYPKLRQALRASAAADRDGERYRWLREQFKLSIDERISREFVRHAKDGDVYKNVRQRWCIYELQDDYRFGQDIEGDGEPMTFDEVIDAAMLASAGGDGGKG